MSSRTTRGSEMTSRAMLPLLWFVELAKYLGFGKQVARLVVKRAKSQGRMAQAFAGYHPTEHDVLVATFGKSGTNWMMQIAQQISHYGEAEFDHIHDLVAWPDAPRPMGIELTDPMPLERSPTGLRVIKTHLDTDFVPYDEKATYLTVLRDPKEVLVSSYYFLGGIVGLLNHLSIDDWYELFMASDSMATAWAKHTASFWDWRDRSNVLVLNFAEVNEQPRASIERVAAVMGVALTEEQLAKVVERSSFEYMRAHESQFAPPQLPFIKRTDPVLMVRRGKSGGSGELLSQSQQAAVDRVCQAELHRLGSDFPYPTTFEVVSNPIG